MSAISGFDIVFPQDHVRTALLVSLLSVSILVALFHYLNRYTQRHYFTIWTAAWLFYGLFLTVGVTVPDPPPESLAYMARVWCVSLSAVFLLWGSLAFLELQTPQALFGWFIAFLLIWGYAGRIVTQDAFYVQLPTFVLTGLTSMFAGFSFYRLRHDRKFVGVRMLFVGFSLWGAYLVMYPFSQRFGALINAGLLFSSVLQLFIAVSMIVLVLEEARYICQQMEERIKSLTSEKRDLQIQVASTQLKSWSLFQQARLQERLRSAYDESRPPQQSVMQESVPPLRDNHPCSA